MKWKYLSSNIFPNMLRVFINVAVDFPLLLSHFNTICFYHYVKTVGPLKPFFQYSSRVQNSKAAPDLFCTWRWQQEVTARSWKPSLVLSSWINERTGMYTLVRFCTCILTDVYDLIIFWVTAMSWFSYLKLALHKEESQILSVKLGRTVSGKLISVGRIPWNHSKSLLLFRCPINLYRAPLTLAAAAFPYSAQGRCEQHTVVQGFRSNSTELTLGL